VLPLTNHILDIHLCLFRIAFREDDPNARLRVDPSTPINATDDGNTNAQIPAPGIPGHFLENPPIYYGTALIWYLIWLWNLRISYPFEDLLQLADDVSAAFHRILYHPTLAPAFASVWNKYLVIPVGTIFGARNSPSFYMEAGEARAHLAMHVPQASSLPMEDLAASVQFPPLPTPAEAALFAQAICDSQHPGITHATSDDPVLLMTVVPPTVAPTFAHASIRQYGQPDKSSASPSRIPIAHHALTLLNGLLWLLQL